MHSNSILYNYIISPDILIQWEQNREWSFARQESWRYEYTYHHDLIEIGVHWITPSSISWRKRKAAYCSKPERISDNSVKIFYNTFKILSHPSMVSQRLSHRGWTSYSCKVKTFSYLSESLLYLYQFQPNQSGLLLSNNKTCQQHAGQATVHLK